MENQNQNNIVSNQNQNNAIVRPDIVALFAGDSYGLFVFQKTERLVRAIYLLTGILSDKEPMRERIRTLANNMLESALGMSDRIWGEETFQKNLLSAVSEVSVIFNIAENTKMMSKMNHQIISSELHKLADFLVTSSANYSSAKIAFEPNLFDGDYNYIPDQSFNVTSPTQNKINESKSNFLKDNIVSKGHNESVLDDINNKKNENGSFTKAIVSVKKVKDKNNRQEIILSMLDSGVKLTIKDFAKNIQGCSEKTIQRELLSLVLKGVLKKEGERRWSKYFLNK